MADWGRGKERGWAAAALHALYHKITKWRKIEDLLFKLNKQTLNIQSVSKKMVFCGKTAITSFKLIQNAKSGGVLENSGYLLHYGHWDFQNWRRNAWENEAWSCQPPLQKSAEFTAHIIHSFDDPLHFHDLQWNQTLFHTLVECKVKVVLYPWPNVSNSRTIIP